MSLTRQLRDINFESVQCMVAFLFPEYKILNICDTMGMTCDVYLLNIFSHGDQQPLHGRRDVRRGGRGSAGRAGGAAVLWAWLHPGPERILILRPRILITRLNTIHKS